jgi:hypothetical protein
VCLRGEATRCSLCRVSANGDALGALSHPARLRGAESGTAKKFKSVSYILYIYRLDRRGVSMSYNARLPRLVLASAAPAYGPSTRAASPARRQLLVRGGGEGAGAGASRARPPPNQEPSGWPCDQVGPPGPHLQPANPHWTQEANGGQCLGSVAWLISWLLQSNTGCWLPTTRLGVLVPQHQAAMYKTCN